MQQLEIVFGGQGGQGVRLASSLLGHACALAGRQVASSAAYGPEVRGSYTRAEVIVSDEMIIYPRVLQPNILIALSQEAYNRSSGEVQPGGLILYEAEAVSPTDTVRAPQYAVPAIRMATEVGDPGAANMVMLGALVGCTGVIDLERLKGVLPETRRRSNEVALEKGFYWAIEHCRDIFIGDIRECQTSR